MVNGVVFTFVAGSVSAGTNIGVGDTVSNLLAAIDSVTGATATPSTVSGGQIGFAQIGDRQFQRPQFQIQADVKNLLRFLRGQLADHRAAIGIKFDESLSFQAF